MKKHSIGTDKKVKRKSTSTPYQINNTTIQEVKKWYNISIYRKQVFIWALIKNTMKV